jgi:hypothetical protein
MCDRSPVFFSFRVRGQREIFVNCSNGIMGELVYEWLLTEFRLPILIFWLRSSAILNLVSYSLFEDVVIVIGHSLVSQSQARRKLLVAFKHTNVRLDNFSKPSRLYIGDARRASKALFGIGNAVLSAAFRLLLLFEDLLEPVCDMSQIMRLT